MEAEFLYTKFREFILKSPVPCFGATIALQTNDVMVRNYPELCSPSSVRASRLDLWTYARVKLYCCDDL